MRIWLGVLLSVLVFDAAAEIYKWVDSNGTVHFEDRKPQGTRYEQIRVKSFSGVQVYRAPAVRSASKAVAKSTQNKDIVMYGTSWCTYCKQARRYFQANNIPFQDYDIEASADARADYDALGGKGVPLIVVGDSLMSGFSESHFSKLYDR